MSDTFITGIKYAHTLLVTLFVLHYLFKAVLYFSGKREGLVRYRRLTRILFDMAIPTLFIITGIVMLAQIGMANIGGWFHLKLTLVIILIPLSYIGFRKENKPLILLSSVLYIYLMLLAFLKTPLLFF